MSSSFDHAYDYLAAGDQSIHLCFYSLNGIVRGGRGDEALSWPCGNGFVIVALEEKCAMTIKQNCDEMNDE